MRLAGTSQRYGSKRITGKQAEASLTRLLCGCTPERLRDMTARELHATHNVPMPKCEQMLAQARARRGV